MGWFRKQRPVAAGLSVDLDGQWRNAEGQLNGHHAFVRVNAGLNSILGHAAYGHSIVACIAINDCRDDGMPSTEEELEAIDAIEELFRDTLQTNYEALLAVVVTTDGRRYLIFYTSNPEAARRRFEEELRPYMRTHHVQFSIFPDARWETYRRFM